MNSLSLFKLLADDTRLTCMLLLSLRPSLCVCDLQSLLSLSQPKISRHLAQLRKAQLVLAERRGQWVHYQLHPELPAWCLTILRQSARQEQMKLTTLLARLPRDCELECP